MKAGERVMTPDGSGWLYKIEEETAVVEMDYQYLVEYSLIDVWPIQVSHSL